MKKLVCLLGVFTLLSMLGCTGAQVSESYVLSGDEGAIVIGIKSDGAGYSLAYNGYDSKTNIKNDQFAVSGSFGRSMYGTPSDMYYFVGAEREGDYYISQISFLGYQSKTVHPVGSPALTFEVRPGEVLYLGEFEVTRMGEIKHLGFDDEKAKNRLKDFQGIQGEFRRADLEFKELRREQK